MRQSSPLMIAFVRAFDILGGICRRHEGPFRKCDKRFSVHPTKWFFHPNDFASALQFGQ